MITTGHENRGGTKRTIHEKNNHKVHFHDILFLRKMANAGTTLMPYLDSRMLDQYSLYTFDREKLNYFMLTK